MNIHTRTTEVDWWDHEGLEVRCPWCGDTHVQLQGAHRYRCIAPCDSTRSARYSMKPLVRSSSVAIGFEIDKTKFRFIPGGAHVSRGEGRPDDEASQDDEDGPGFPQLRISITPGSLDSVASLVLTPELIRLCESKAFAGMRRDGGLPDVFALSGWKHTENKRFRVAGQHWTHEVLRLCRAIGFTLMLDIERDQGVPGQFNVCHVEKQLIAYFIHKHLVLPHELDIPEDVDIPEDLGNDDLAELFGELDIQNSTVGVHKRRQEKRTRRKDERSYKIRLGKLWEARPSQSLTRAIIVVNNRYAKIASDLSRM